MTDEFIEALKKNRIFCATFFFNIVFILVSYFNDNPSVTNKIYFITLSCLFILLFQLINIVDSKFTQSFFLEELNSSLPDNFEELIKNTKSIKMLGIHLSSILTNFPHAIEYALKKGTTIELIIVPIDSNAIKMTASRYINSNIQTAIDKENQRLKEVHSILKEYNSTFSNQITVKEIDYLFEHQLILLDSLTVDTRYNFGTKPSNMKPKYFYKRKTQWYDFCLSEFNNHWKKAKDVNLRNS